MYSIINFVLLAGAAQAYNTLTESGKYSIVVQYDESLQNPVSCSGAKADKCGFSCLYKFEADVKSDKVTMGQFKSIADGCTCMKNTTFAAQWSNGVNVFDANTLRGNKDWEWIKPSRVVMQPNATWAVSARTFNASVENMVIQCAELTYQFDNNCNPALMSNGTKTCQQQSVTTGCRIITSDNVTCQGDVKVQQLAANSATRRSGWTGFSALALAVAAVLVI